LETSVSFGEEEYTKTQISHYGALGRKIRSNSLDFHLALSMRNISPVRAQISADEIPV
jgi:hypothetical protein